MVAERPLSAPEVAVLELVCEGLTSAEIAARRGGSEHTVKAHLKRAYRALGVHTRAAAVVAFRGLGLPGGMADREAAVAAREQAVADTAEAAHRAGHRAGWEAAVVAREQAVADTAEAAHRAGHRAGWEAAVVALGAVHMRDWQRALNGADPYGTRAGRILATHLRRSYPEERTTP
jgi:DNA-binding CsgD family transcriptional regulator